MKKPWLILTLIEVVVLIFLVQSVGSSLAVSPVSSSSPPVVSFPYREIGIPILACKEIIVLSRAVICKSNILIHSIRMR